MNSFNYHHILSLLVILGLSSCVVPESNHIAPDFYLLSQTQTAELNNSKVSNHSFYMKEVEIPEFLNSSKMVSRPDKYSVEFRESKRWGEPLSDGIARVVSLNLANELNTNFFSIFPNRRERELLWDIGLSVTDFGRIDLNKVRLAVLWEIQHSKEEFSRRGSYSLDLEIDGNLTDSAQNETRSLNKCLHRLSVELAEVINGDF